MDLMSLLKNTKFQVLLLVLIVIGAGLGLMAMGEDDDDDKKGGPGSGSGPPPSSNATIDHYEDSGVCTGVVGVGMNGEFVFNVSEGAFKIVVICNGTGASGMEDLDLELDGPDGGHATSGNPSSNERIELLWLDIHKRFGYGDYTATIVAYAALGTTYDLSVDVYYATES